MHWQLKSSCEPYYRADAAIKTQLAILCCILLPWKWRPFWCTASIDFHCAPKWLLWRLPSCCYAVTSYANALFPDHAMDCWVWFWNLLIAPLHIQCIAGHLTYLCSLQSQRGWMEAALQKYSLSSYKMPNSLWSDGSKLHPTTMSSVDIPLLVFCLGHINEISWSTFPLSDARWCCKNKPNE